MYQEHICALRRLGKYTKKGYLNQLIEAKKEKYKLPDHTVINASMIRARIHRNNFIVNSMGPDSPMMEVEPSLVKLYNKDEPNRKMTDSNTMFKVGK